MTRYNYLNLGCGKHYHPAWTNVDMVSFDPNVKEANLLKGIPYPTDTFEVVYHSHVLEHFSKDAGVAFVRECYRVLAPGGIIRIALPDLEKIVRLYLQFLQQNIENPTEESIANYHWMMIEMYDQAVRTKSGGYMKQYLYQDNIVNKDFVLGRIGLEAENALNEKANPRTTSFGEKLQKFWKLNFRNKIQLIHDILWGKLLIGRSKQFFKSGQQRLSGELHCWMYDRFSLGQLLKEVGFKDVKVQTATESYISDWKDFNLDTTLNGKVIKPDSLFIEAVK